MPTRKHGGPRKGAGRPPTGKPRREKTAITVEPGLLARARARAALLDVSLSHLIELALAHYLSNSDARQDEPPPGA